MTREREDGELGPVRKAVMDAVGTFGRLNALSPERRAGLLDALAAAASRERQQIITTCSDETGLTPDELAPEFDRMTGTLKMFADLVREGSWVRAAIDTKAAPGQSIGPGHDVRSMLVPLGPVAVFGASNFPLAYGVLGGDTASAIAAGCPVVVKEHPAHPRTGRLLAELARGSIRGDEDLFGLVGYVENDDPADNSIAQGLVGHRHIAAVGFTGSYEGGMAIDRIARQRPAPIPVFAEMGSINLVLVMPDAAAQRGETIGAEIGSSIVARVGQQCTGPGIVMLNSGKAGDRVVDAIRSRLAHEPSRTMLSAHVCRRYERAIEVLGAVGGASVWRPSSAHGSQGQPALIELTIDGLELPSAVRSAEVFGPGAVIVRVHPGAESMLALGHAAAELALPAPSPSLAISVYATDTDFNKPTPNPLRFLLVRSQLASHAGRITFNTVPTGVRVATAMVHGGPFPATNAPHTTAVGPRAIERWCRPVCFQNCPDALLPDELKNANPRGIWRTVNGQLTRNAVA